MILAHRIALDPTHQQRAYFARAAGTARFTWNWGLAHWEQLHQHGDKPTSHQLKKLFNALKYEQFPWLHEIHRDAHAQPFVNLQNAFTAYQQGQAEKPRFKSKKRDKDSFYVTNDKFRLDGRRVRLPVVGWVRLREALRFMGKIQGATVSREADRWYLSVQVDLGDYHQPRQGQGVVGVDLGVQAAATLSTGEVLAGPKPLRQALRQLRRRSRQLSRKQYGSANRRKAKQRLAPLHARISNLRRDFLHPLTTRLCRENQAVVIEDLNVRGMLGGDALSVR